MANAQPKNARSPILRDRRGARGIGRKSIDYTGRRAVCALRRRVARLWQLEGTSMYR